MASGSEKLKEDFEQVKKLLETYPNIKIIKTEGDPPEHYDIQYTIKGYRTNPDGTASPDNKHEVRISLPFGYPHFPPTAKPLTPIFHPDIDPDAIRIADFWQENTSLPDLIVHIGQMICGNHYTKEEPFNQSAFEWFEERKSWLPFDILEPKDEDEVEAIEEAESEPEQVEAIDAALEQSFASAKDLDILKDDIEFPFEEEEEGAEADEISFDIEEELADSGDEISFDIEEEEVTEDLSGLDEEADELTFDFEEPEAEETEDTFSLEPDASVEDVSFDLEDIAEEIESAKESQEIGDLSQLEQEEPAGGTEAETTLEFDSEDLSSAFEVEEEAGIPSEETEAVDISLDDLSGLEKEEESLDFGIAEESMDMGGDATADLSGLEEAVEEQEEELEQVPESGIDDEEKILSALSLDEDFTSAGKADDLSLMIRTLIDQKQIFSAKKAFAEVPDPDSLPNKEELQLSIANAIGEAEDMYQKADKHEQKGEFEKAGILLDLVANIAADFPGLEMARNRIRESMMGEGKKKPAPEGEEKKPADKFIGEEEAPAEKPEKKKKKARAKIRIRIPARVVVIFLAVLLLAGIGTGAMYVYNNDLRNIKLARTAFQKAEQLVDSKDFKGAQKEFASTSAQLEKVFIFQRSEKNALTGKIKSILNSSLFREGLQGRVLYGDQYVSIDTAKAIDKFNTQKEYAEKVLKAGKYDQAIEGFEKSLTYAEKAGLEDELQSIKHKISELRLQSALSQAKQSEASEDWANAEKAYTEAFELSKTISTPEEQQNIATKKATAAYRHNLDQGLKAVKDSLWLQSIDSFLSAKKVLKENPQIVSGNELLEIDKQLVHSRLYFELAEARKAYESRQWDQAIKTYNDAIALLQENTDILDQETADDIKKIEKTILTTRVAREQALVASTRENKELEKTVEHYGRIADLIEKSPFKDDEALAKILEDARKKKIDIKNELLISTREQWLKENYEQIFRDNYPSAKLSDLMNPKVRFVKREENTLVFNLSCTERKQGSTFRLELYYQNNLDKDTWSLYSGKIEEEEN